MQSKQDTSQDVIERQIEVNASPETVWNLISKTGFWAGERLQFGVDAVVGNIDRLDAGKYGTFPVEVVALDPPRYAAYRWASGFPNQDLTETNATLVEFSIEPQQAGVVVRVRESGFAALEGTHAFREDNFRGNSEGWTAQLDQLKTAAERETR